MKKRVLIDASTVTDIPDGLSVYIINLLRHLPESSFDEIDYTILTLPQVDREDFRSAIADKPFRRIERQIAGIGPRRDWAMRRFFKAHGREFDLVHITSNSYPFALKGGVWTVHDVTFKRWFHNPRGVPGARHLAVAYMSSFIRHALRHADRVIAVSKSTRDDIWTQFRPSERQMDKIGVVYEGWEHLDDYPVESCHDFVPSEDGYIFFLGSFRPHKNLERFLEAFELALDRLPKGKKLVISGSSNRLSPSMRERVERLNRDGERVRFTGYISNACVGRYYQDADAFIFPSLAEGFGIPSLEAFYYGTPLLCAHTTSIPEVAGDAALYFDPTDVRSMADAMVRFYADPALGPELARKGRERLQLFSWRKAAEETVAIYREQLGIAR
jgi:glycosyltransferase involved in cell wall biosynthesis